jgi:C4-dicarboxylate transporter DctQ subunit
MGYGAILTIGGWDLVSVIYSLEIESEDLPIPQWLPYLILPIGFGLLFLRLAQVAYRMLFRGQQRFQLADEAAETIERSKRQEGQEQALDK